MVRWDSAVVGQGRDLAAGGRELVWHLEGRGRGFGILKGRGKGRSLDLV